jgi:hypothetical protein
MARRRLGQHVLASCRRKNVICPSTVTAAAANGPGPDSERTRMSLYLKLTRWISSGHILLVSAISLAGVFFYSISPGGRDADFSTPAPPIERDLQQSCFCGLRRKHELRPDHGLNRQLCGGLLCCCVSRAVRRQSALADRAHEPQTGNACGIAGFGFDDADGRRGCSSTVR